MEEDHRLSALSHERYPHDVVHPSAPSWPLWQHIAVGLFVGITTAYVGVTILQLLFGPFLLRAVQRTVWEGMPNPGS